MIIVYFLLPVQNNLLSNIPKNSIQTLREEEFFVDIVFIGFDENIVLEENIEFIMGSIVSDPFQYSNGSFPHSRYNINYTFSYLSEVETNDMENFLLDNAENRTLAGYRANITAIDELMITRNMTDPADYFIPYGGLVIDADLVEDYIYQNLFEEKTRLEYTMYMLNFSQFDAPDHSLEHTYSVEHYDYDTNTHIPLGYPTNETIDYAPVAGWGGKHRFCYIDPSASLDYVQYLPLLYGLDTLYGDYYYYDYDLDGYCSTLDLTEYLGKASLAIYLQEWIQSYLNNIFSPTAIVTPPMTETISIQCHVINNATHIGYLTDSLNWVTTAERIAQPFTTSFPWINWGVEVVYSEMVDYPELYSIMMSNSFHDEFGYYVELGNGLAQAFDSEQENYFDMERAGTIIPVYVFITDNSTFRFGENFINDLITVRDTSFFESIVLQRSVYDIFVNGSVSNPFIGVSSTLIRLLGHFMSFPITYRWYYGWGTAYVDDVMSIFARELCGSVSFSSFYIDAYSRYFFDYYYYHISTDLLLMLEQYRSVGPLIGANKYEEQVTNLVEEAYILYSSMDYVPAIEKLLDAQEILDEFRDLVENPSAFQKPAVFWSVTIVGGTAGLAAIVYFVNKFVKFPIKK